MTTASNATMIDTPSECEIVIRRHVGAPRDLVFAAYTQAEHVPNWMLGPDGWSMPICEIDLRPGGAWRFVWRKNDGQELAMSGEYLEVVPPERVVSSERWGAEWPETINTVVFREENCGTLITISVMYPSKQARDAALQSGMTEGMQATFAKLSSYLEPAA